MAKAADVMSAMGVKETGSHEQLASKFIAAAAPVSGVSASGIALATTRAAADAKLLGLSDEELIAAVSAVSSTTGSAELAGTQVASLLKSMTEKGFVEEHKGKSLTSMLNE